MICQSQSNLLEISKTAKTLLRQKKKEEKKIKVNYWEMKKQSPTDIRHITLGCEMSVVEKV